MLSNARVENKEPVRSTRVQNKNVLFNSKLRRAIIFRNEHKQPAHSTRAKTRDCRQQLSVKVAANTYVLYI